MYLLFPSFIFHTAGMFWESCPPAPENHCATKSRRCFFVYAAQKRLLTERFLLAVKDVEISMVCVDEAHCISQWGQDFRPSYLKIRDYINTLACRPVISTFAATATKEVREDILALLGLENPVQMITGFNRENLKFLVCHPADKWKETLKILKNHEDECGIIYCLTRKSVEELCAQLIKQGYSATRYHAGLSDAERRHNQEEGRAGRDGLPSECILLYSGEEMLAVSGVGEVNFQKYAAALLPLFFCSPVRLQSAFLTFYLANPEGKTFGITTNNLNILNRILPYTTTNN